MLTLDFKYNYVFQYLDRGVEILNILITSIYVIPFTYQILILSILLFSYRMKYGSYIRNNVFRRSLYVASLILASLYLSWFIVHPIERITHVKTNLVNGNGVYPLLDNPLVILSALLLIFSTSIFILLSSIEIGHWIRHLKIIDNVSKYLLIIASITVSLSYLLYLAFKYIFLIGKLTYYPTIYDVLFIGFLSSILFYRGSKALTKVRILGCHPFSSYTLLTISALSISYLKPEVVLDIFNAINLKTFIAIFIVTSIFAWIGITTEIFRKFFYPWGSEDAEYFIRGSGALAYIIIIILSFMAALNLSIYYSFGQIHVRPNLANLEALYSLLVIGLSVSVISNIIIKFKRNFYILHGISLTLIVLVLAFLILDYYLLLLNTLIILLLVAISTILISWRLKILLNVKVELSKILIAISIILILAPVLLGGYVEYANILEVKSIEKPIPIKYLNSSTYIANNKVLLLNDSKIIERPLYNLTKVNLEVNGRNTTLLLYRYTAKDLNYSTPYLIQQNLLSMYKIRIEEASKDIIKIGIYRYYWSQYINMLTMILIAIGLIFYIYEEYKVRKT